MKLYGSIAVSGCKSSVASGLRGFAALDAPCPDASVGTSDCPADDHVEGGGGLLAGGGFRTGQVVGATDRHGASITDRPVHFAEVLAALYRHLGIDPAAGSFTDHAGRPQALLDKTEPMPELA